MNTQRQHKISRIVLCLVFFILSLVFLILSGKAETYELNTSNFLFVTCYILLGISIGIVIGSPNFKKEQIIQRNDIHK